MKNLPANVVEMLESGYIKQVYAIHFAFDTPLAFADAGHDIEHNGITYTASGSFQGLDQLQTTAEMRVGEMTVGFSLADQGVSAIIFGSETYNRKCTVVRMYLDDMGDVFHVEHVWQGKVTGQTTSDEDGTVSLTVGSRWAAFEKANTWRTTDFSHKRRFPNDEAMKFASSAEETIYWAGEAGA